MKVVTTKQMAEIEDMSEKLGVTKKELMHNAGIEITRKILDICSEKKFIIPKDTGIVFLAGSGNNGGDCFVSAKLLADENYDVTVVNLVNEPSTELAKENFNKLPENVRIINYWQGGNDEKETAFNEVAFADIVVDGVFGTGFHGELDKNIIDIFSVDTEAYKLSIDIPSGGNGSTGNVSDEIFKADETICLGCLKFGMTQYPLKKFCGKITVADIGIPQSAYNVSEGKREYCRIDRNSLAGFPPKREPDAHKGTFGTVLVISGSSLMRGAAAFSVLGALKSGAGIVRLATVGKCIDTVSVLAPEATFIELESDGSGFMRFDERTEKILYDAVKKADSIVIGSGMGVTDDTMEIVRFVVRNAEVPIIIDADGINCIAKDIEILMGKKSEVIITPHPGEMARLLKCDSKTINENRIMVAEEYAEQYGITVVLKGAGTIISDRHRTSANHTGNAGMSKGGSGDILSGIIGSFVAQGISPYDSACAGVYMHGLAGDVASEKFGQEAMLPRDIINCLSDSFRILKEKQES